MQGSRVPNLQVCGQCMHYHVLTARTVLHALLAMALLVRIALQPLEDS